MKTPFRSFKAYLAEADDPSYYQDTFYFTVLISMNKDIGGSRDETKNDIRALPEVLTVTLVEPEKGGVQRDLGTKYLSTLKLHVRRPKTFNKALFMKKIVLQINNLRGVSVLRFKERLPKQRRKAFRGTYKIDESGPPLAEAMKTAADLPEDVVVVVLKESDGTGFQVYYAHRDKPNIRLKAGDLGRMEAGIDVFGTLHVGRGRNQPYEGVYIIQSAKAKDGFGPLLYDVALELAGEDGLKPAVEDVSDDASAVWKYYDTQREDIRGTMLVTDPDEYSLVMPYDRAEHPEANQHLAKVYFKKDKSVTQELIDQDKFVELKPGTQVPTPSAREELTDLAGELDIPIVKNTDLSRFDRLYEDVLITIGKQVDTLMTFDVRPSLNQRVWDKEVGVRRGVRGALMEIVDEFLEGLDLDLDVKDIVITGSIANYNWSRFSDIDVHIVLDFEEVNDNKEMVKKFFDAVRANWNKLHTILVKGHEVEIYIQDAHEPHISTGVYSLLNDEWLVKPKKIKPAIDRCTAVKKMKQLSREVAKLAAIHERGDYEAAYEFAQRIKEKIKKMRQAGLEATGIYSPENLAFKMLRRSGEIQELFDIYTQAYDRLYSLDQ